MLQYFYSRPASSSSGAAVARPASIRPYVFRSPAMCLHLQCIERIGGLSGCPQLQKLWLMENRISKVEGLEACTGLQELYLYSNRLSNVTGLDHLTRLKVGSCRQPFKAAS
eukprot:GHRQ01029612.1.p2 GENE.GHRQ01029612.1~~GHRQ01029612.1.p2  ORF type:complete len:111 (-),score=20.69 GHRQ01029612.1:623-955(-)